MRVLSVEALREELERRAKVVVVDVREPDEVQAGAIPGTVSLPRARVAAEIDAIVPDRATPIVTLCASGARAELAAQTLLDLGYEDVRVARPGFGRWKELGYPVEVTSSLTEAQRDRYGRHLALPEVGEAGQARLLRARVLLVGAGGLGSPAALYLGAAGVGTIGVVDHDVVDASNLQRQVLHATSRIGSAKVESAARTIADLNPDVRVVPREERVHAGNVERLFADHDVVVDGSDNFPTRYLLSDASVLFGKPVVHASVHRFEGQVTTLVPPRAAARLGTSPGPCYRCLFPAPPPPHLAPSCREAGVLGVVPGLLGVLQATEVLKLLLGKGDALIGRLLTFDALAMRFRELRLRPSPTCPACGPDATLARVTVTDDGPA